MTPQFHPMPTDLARAYRAGRPDANGMPPERTVSDGDGNPCRHCLGFVPKGRDMLILAYRPFDRLQPYAETGPIFLCADDCAAWSGQGVPPILASSPDYLLRGYDADQRIRYGTGKVVGRAALVGYAAELLARPETAFVDVRSARNNCFQCRMTRGDAHVGAAP
jgi:hypothetical protein